MNILKHNDVYISKGDDDIPLLNDKRLKSFRILETESNLILVEYILRKKRCVDKIPVHIGSRAQHFELKYINIQILIFTLFRPTYKLSVLSFDKCNYFRRGLTIEINFNVFEKF